MRKKILILTTSVFTDRIYQHSTFLDEIKNKFEIVFWARSYYSNPSDWIINDVEVKPIPPVKMLDHYTSYFRRINEFAWMYKLNAKSLKINYKYKSEYNCKNKSLLILGWLIAKLNLFSNWEYITKKLISENSANNEINSLLKELSPDYLLVSNPFWVEEPLVALEANKIGIPVISLIPSWDNITTKSRITYNSFAYGVWSSIRKVELFKYYPDSKTKPLFIYGTPQYDIFQNPTYYLEKKSFYEKYDLIENVPIILFTIGSPLFIPSEIDVCLAFCKEAQKRNLLGKVQILIRPNPIKDFSEYFSLFKDIDKNIHIQYDVHTSKEVEYRFQDKDMIKNWVSTFNYCDILIATSSTTILDAAMLNKPHINIAANLTNDQSLNSFIDEVSFEFEHLKKINDEGLFNNIINMEELIKQLEIFIHDPVNFINKSDELVKHLAEFKNNGKYGQLFAKNLIQITQ